MVPAPGTAPGRGNPECAADHAVNGMVARFEPAVTLLPGWVKSVKAPGSGKFVTVAARPALDSVPSPSKPDTTDPDARATGTDTVLIGAGAETVPSAHSAQSHQGCPAGPGSLIRRSAMVLPA